MYPIPRSNIFSAFFTLVLLFLLPHISLAQSEMDQPTLGTFNIGYKLQALEADIIQDAYVETTGMNIVSIQFTPSLSPVLGAFISYEFTPGNEAEQDELIALQSKSTDNGWKRILANFEFKITDRWGMGFSYDDQSFLNSVQSNKDYWFVSETSAQLLIPGDSISIATVFNNTEAYITLSGSQFDTHFGWFSIDYQKPFATDALTTVTTIFDSKLKASGPFFRINSAKSSDGLAVSAAIKYAIDPEITVNGQNIGQISGNFISSVNTLSYVEYSIDISYTQKIFNIPTRAKLEYTTRIFEDIVDEALITDDTIIGFSVSFLFSI